MEPNFLRCGMLTSPGSVCQVCGDYWPADWQSGRLDDFDDVEVPNSMTELMRENLTALHGSRIHLDSERGQQDSFPRYPANHIYSLSQPVERNYRPFVWPSRYPRDVAKYEGLLAPQLQEDIDMGAEEWTVTDPDRFDNDDLLEREASMGRSNFMLQFMLDTSLSDAEKFPLKMVDLVITSVNPKSAPENVIWCSDPANVIKDAPTVGLPGDYFYSPMQLQGEWGSYDETICSIDPSGRGTDETAAAYISQRNGVLYLHEMRAYRDGYSDNTLLDILRGYGKKYNVTKLLIETNFGDGIVAELFRKHLIQTKQAIDT